jgi:hypothetical protein
MMDNMTMALHQTESSLHSTAHGLFHTALCAVGDAALAGRAAADAFVDAVNRIPDTSDAGLFRMRCYSLLYRYCKKIPELHDYPRGRISDTAEYNRHSGGRKRLSEILARMSFDERFIILLFCLEKYSVRQIAKITRLPGFIVEKRLNAAVKKAMR